MYTKWLIVLIFRTNVSEVAFGGFVVAELHTETRVIMNKLELGIRHIIFIEKCAFICLER